MILNIVFFIRLLIIQVNLCNYIKGVLAGICFHLHWIKGKETLEKWQTKVTLQNLNSMGFVSAVLCIVAMIWYLFLTFYYKISIQPISESTIIPAVWSMICGKWSITLMYYSNKYGLLIQEETSPLLIDNA
ncbi:uncharacterized protein LOC105422726 [Pogonomyrmex barbatus]|uniref:Uncharacterized protein LOC105422726 n=1 Tax=Pogonomyrmex barbatus TaxID=144034 RepID=A0A6I9VPC4_9HYME|nr:uncharacterized protein LOC105422726 [Pogonomyrmex barbatus]